MASRKKQLEAELREAGAGPKLLCACGDEWESLTHFTKSGELRKKLDKSIHYSTSIARLMGSHTRAGRAGSAFGFSKARAPRGRQVLPSIATHVARRNAKTGKLERIQVAPRLSR